MRIPPRMKIIMLTVFLLHIIDITNPVFFQFFRKIVAINLEKLVLRISIAVRQEQVSAAAASY